MPSSVQVDHERKVVITTITGPVHSAEVGPLSAQAREHATRHGYHLLYDASDASNGDISLADIFWYPRTIPALKLPEARRLRIAVVYPPEGEEFARFWETTFTNSGLAARAFADREGALAWLTA